MFKLALRNIFRHKGRTLLTLAAIVMGVAGLILSGGFIEDVFIQLREATIHSSFGHLQVYKAGYYEQGRQDPYKLMLEKPDPLMGEFQNLPHIEVVSKRINFSGLLNNGLTDLPIIGEGIEADKEAIIGSFIEITAGRQLTDGESYGVLVGQGVADALQLKPGDYTTLLANTPDGMLNSLEFEVVGIFRSISQEYDARAIRVPLVAIQELLDIDAAHSLVISLTSTDVTDIVAEKLRQQLPAGQYEVKTWYQLAEFYQKTVNLYERQFLVLQLIILLLVLLGVANSVNITVYDRTGEFGTLLALGDRGSEVFSLVLLENILLGALGGGLGVLIGILLAGAISIIGIPMPPPPNMNIGYTALIRIVPEVVVTACLLGFVTTALAAILPAWRVSKIPVADALRHV